MGFGVDDGVMVTNFEYEDTREEGEKRVWCFIDKFLQLHKAHVLESMRIQLDHYQCIQIDHHQYYNDTVLSKCVSYALDHCVRELAFSLPLYRTQILFLPPNVYTSKTLVTLTLAGIIIDVPSLLCLPSLQTLVLIFVVYKDQNSHVRLLANCPSLKNLDVERDSSDNVTRFNVKVPSLKSFTYLRNHIGGAGTSSLGLDSPGLRHLNFFDPFGDLGSIQNMPHLDIADVSQIVPHLNNDKYLRSFSSVRILHLCLNDVTILNILLLPILMIFLLFYTYAVQLICHSIAGCMF